MTAQTGVENEVHRDVQTFLDGEIAGEDSVVNDVTGHFFRAEFHQGILVAAAGEDADFGTVKIQIGRKGVCDFGTAVALRFFGDGFGFFGGACGNLCGGIRGSGFFVGAAAAAGDESGSHKAGEKPCEDAG